MSLITIAQITISVIIIILILIQERSSGITSFLGGSEGGFYQARRGLEKFTFIATLVLIAAFVALSLLNLIS